jgi:hypothetical protein
MDNAKNCNREGATARFNGSAFRVQRLEFPDGSGQLKSRPLTLNREPFNPIVDYVIHLWVADKMGIVCQEIWLVYGNAIRMA